jgi:preprotein translocase subunit SecD
MFNFGVSEKRRSALLVLVLALAGYLLYPTINVALNGREAAVASTEVGEQAKASLSKPISLGLDLSGGVHLVYKVLADEAVQARLQSLGIALKNTLRDSKVAVTKAEPVRIQQAGLMRSAVKLTILSDTFLDRAKTAIQSAHPDLQFLGEERVDGRAIVTLAIPDAQVSSERARAIEQAVETLRNRVDQFGVSEPLIQRIGTDRILLQMPGVKDIESVKRIVGKVAKLEFRFLPATGAAAGSLTVKTREGTPVQVEDEVQMTGASVQNARVGFDPNGQVQVNLELNSEGSKTFAAMTSANVGRNLGIILDGVMYSSPVIREAITGGNCSISGGFTPEEARDLAVVLRAGALPAPLEVMEERTVGPTLGAESIRKGVIACLVGFAAISIFMVLYYKKSGVLAVFSLMLNLVLVLALLSAFGATLTLPGLAGLALTVGMAVDSNVIIFERIRDELRAGSGRDIAVDLGFGKAFSAIADSNITTFLTASILYYFGTGPVKGFAVTLSIGIFTTVFCAVFVGRLLMDVFPLKGKKLGLSI